MKTKCPLPKGFSGTRRVFGILVGLLALALIVAPGAGAAPFAYISNMGNKTVSVIDAGPQAVCLVAGQMPPCVVKTLTVGPSPGGVAVNPAGTFAYVVNSGDGTVSVINTADNTVAASIPVGFGPWGVAVSPDNAKVYVGLSDSSITVIDASTLTAVASIPTAGGTLNGIVAVGSRIFVADATFGQVVVIDVPSLSVFRRIDVGSPPNSAPMGIVANATGTRVYVTDIRFDGNNLVNVFEASAIDTSLVDNPSRNPVVGTWVIDPDPVTNPQPTNDTLATPGGVALSPDGSRLYVPTDSSDDVTIITLSNGSRAHVAVGTQPMGIATDPSGFVYVVNVVAQTVSVIDPVTNAVVKTIGVGPSPFVFGSFATAGPPPPPQFMLTLGTVGSGTISPQPASATGMYNAGTAVSLTALPDPGFAFTGWAGACSGSNATCVVTMDSAKSVTATFTAQYSLFVTTLGTGTVTAQPSSTSWQYLAGTSVTLTATADPGFVFTSWAGACSGSNATCVVTMDASKSVTATFTAQYSLFVTTLGNGTVAALPTSTTWKYLSGTVVRLTATPGSDSVFSSWSGACSGSSVTCDVTMDAAKSVTATFTLKQFALSVTPVGPGTVTAQPSSANNTYNVGTVVVLTATPAANGLFSGWSGACSGAATTCSVTMDAAKSVTATFALRQFQLSLTAVGSGTISAQPSSANNMYNAGTVVSLTATPGTGYQFSGWSGACSGTATTCNVTMDAAKSVTVTFALRQFQLSLTPVGSGTISAQPPTANNMYNAGTVVSLTATPGTGYQFSGWSGACSGTATTCNVTMDAAKSVTATFTAQQFALTLTTVGDGSISATPAGGTYPFGTVVTLTANPSVTTTTAAATTAARTAVSAAGSQFVGWSGACATAGTAPTCDVTMNAAKSVTATFTTTPPPPGPRTCDDVIRDLQAKVAAHKRPWDEHGQLKAALRLYPAAQAELAAAWKKVGGSDKLYVRASKEFANGKAALCSGHYWRAHHELWESYLLAHEILKRHGR